MIFFTEEEAEKLLGKERIARYMRHAQGDFAEALGLYLWNIDVAAAVLSTTSIVEVFLRNTIDAGLKRWNCQQEVWEVPGREKPYTVQWVLDPSPPLKNWLYQGKDPLNSKILSNARSAMKDVRGKVTKLDPVHDDYIAAFTFGTWVRFVPSPKAKNPHKFPLSFWEQELGNSFPNQHRNTIFYWVQHLRYARNRASHLEPLLDVEQLQHFHRCAVRLVNSINPEAASWLAGQAYIPQAIAKKPF